MKKILLLFAFMAFSFGSMFAQNYEIGGSFKSTKDGKVYHFDFVNKKFLRYNPVSNQIEAEFDLATIITNWDEKVGSFHPEAIIQNASGESVYFISSEENKYWRMSWSNWTIDAGYPKSLDDFAPQNWPTDWRAGGSYKVQGALYNSDNDVFYFFDFSKGKHMSWDGSQWSSTYDLTSFGSGYQQVERTTAFARSIYTDGGFAFQVINNAILSYVSYVNGNWVGPKRLTDFGGWRDKWCSTFVFNNPSSCTSYSLQSYGGHKLYPFINYDMPFGKLGEEYEVVSANMYLTTSDNSKIQANLYAPGSTPIELFLTGDASGSNFGSTCTLPTSFSDASTIAISEGAAPYNNKAFQPDEGLNSFPAGTRGNGTWYLEISSDVSGAGDMMRRFYVNLQPKKEIQCGVAISEEMPTGVGTWDMSSFCGTAVGKESYYRFTATESGEHFIGLFDDTGDIDFFIKGNLNGFNADGWTCATSAGGDKLTIGTLTEGHTYYILAKAQTTSSTNLHFGVICPSCVPATNLGASNITSTGFTVNMTTSATTQKWQVVPAGNGMGSGIVAQGETNGTAIPVAGLSAGAGYDFYVQSKCGDLYSDPASLLNISTLVAIEDLTSIKEIAFFPNPAKGELNIAINGAHATSLDISVISLLGDMVIHKEINLTSGQNHEILDVSSLSPGTYIVRLIDQGKTAGFRFVKE